VRDAAHVDANRAVHRYLVSHGFQEETPRRRRGKDAAHVAYVGTLPDTTVPWHIRLEIVDWDFIDYPRIELLSAPEGFMPHVDEDRCLCYLASGSLILPRNDPVGSLRRCLIAAAQELDRQAKSGYTETESQYEFSRYWSGSNPALIGTVGTSERAKKTTGWILPSGRLLISDDRDEVVRLYQSFTNDDAGEKKPSCIPAWVIPMSRAPWLTQAGPPSTWQELWDWLAQVDQSACDRLFNVVGRDEFVKARDAAIVFHHDSTWFGFRSAIPSTTATAFTPRPERLAVHLRDGKGKRLKISRFQLFEVGPEYIHGRNLAGDASLAGLTIHLVGAGAIGGFLAEALVRLGAGSGGGKLKIIDPDILGPGNLGRHSLGLDHLFEPKTEALAIDLKRQFPHANVVPLEGDARTIKHLFVADLIVDATGEEALSLVLNEEHQTVLRSGKHSAPMLFVWVLGNGEVVQALLSDGGQRACFECLTIHHPGAVPKKRYEILKEQPTQTRIGCDVVRPYAVSAPMTAAALASQMIADWKTGRPSPRFRSLFLNRGDHLYDRDPDGDPKHLSGCPTCGTT